MEAHRLIAKNENGYLHIHLPENINSKEVDVTLVPHIESVKQEPRKEFFKKLYGSGKSKLTINEIDSQLKLIQSEWQRDI